MAIASLKPEGVMQFGEAVSAQQAQQIRNVAGAIGLNPDHVMRLMRDAEVQRSGGAGFGITNRAIGPEVTAQELDFAQKLMSNAYNSRAMNMAGRPDFTVQAIAKSVAETFRSMRSLYPDAEQMPNHLRSDTARWLEGQARRFGVDRVALQDAAIMFCTLSDSDPKVAEAALRMASASDPRIEALSRIISENAAVSHSSDGTFSYFIPAHKAIAISHRLVLKSVPRRIHPAELRPDV